MKEKIIRNVIRITLIIAIIFINIMIYGVIKIMGIRGVLLDIIFVFGTSAAVRAVWKYTPNKNKNIVELDKTV